MIEEFLYSLFERRKKILGGLIGFIVAILLVTVGLIKTIIVCAISIGGYHIVETNVSEKIKKALVILLSKLDNNN